MRPNARDAVRGAAKLLAVVLAAGVVGVGLGAGLAELTADEASTASPTTDQERREGTTSTAPAAGSANARGDGTQSDDGPRNSTPQVRLRSGVLTPARSPSGRDRRRARLNVQVRVINRSDRAISLENVVLVVDDERVAPDPKAADSSDAVAALQSPIRAGKRASGELRFETAGDVTRTLIRERRASLRILGQTRSVRIARSETTPANP